MEKKLKILVIYEQTEALLTVKKITQAMNVELRASKPQDALEALGESNLDFALIDASVTNPKCDELLAQLLKEYPGLFIAMMTDTANDPMMAKCLKQGAKLGLIRPFAKDDIAVAVQKAEGSVYYAKELKELEDKLVKAKGSEKDLLQERIARLKIVVEDFKKIQEKKVA